MQILSFSAARHTTRVKSQGSDTNQGATSAKTMMTHSLNKEASLLLCDAMWCRVDDGDATAEDWTVSNSDGKSLPADRFWNDGGEPTIAADNEGPCMGIGLNIWELAKVDILIFHIIAIFEFKYHFDFNLCKGTVSDDGGQSIQK
jgi:hypothetical protein